MTATVMGLVAGCRLTGEERLAAWDWDGVDGELEAQLAKALGAMEEWLLAQDLLDANHPREWIESNPYFVRFQKELEAARLEGPKR